jgi:hypothetical protein
MKLNSFAILFAIAWSGFIVWSIRTFWRKPAETSAARFYLQGRNLGVVLIVGAALFFPTIAMFPGLSFWEEVLYIGFLGFPIFTVGGHIFGRILQQIYR